MFQLVFSPAKAGFFDNFFGSNTNTKDKGDFYIQVSDEFGNNETVSHSERNLKVRLFYLRKYFYTIDRLSNSDIEDAFNDAITVKTQLVKNGPKEKLGQGLSFVTKNVKADNINNQYDEIILESTNFIIDTSQKLIFTFDIVEFAKELNISTTGFTQTESEKTINYSPITIELTSASLVLDSDSVKGTDEAFAPQIITQAFKTEFDIDTITQTTSFELFRNGKLIKALAKRAGVPYELSLATDDANAVYVQSKGNGNYEVNIPINLTPKKTKQLKFFQQNKKYKVKVPALIDTYTETGLEVKIKILAKASLTE